MEDNWPGFLVAIVFVMVMVWIALDWWRKGSP